MPLPYHAGKYALSKRISNIVHNKLEENPSIKNYAEPFSGMARVGIQVMQDDKDKKFNKYYFSDVNPRISILFKELKRGWLPKVETITQKKWDNYKNDDNFSAQKSFIGYTLGFGGQYFGGKSPRQERRGQPNFAMNYQKSKRKYLQELQPYFTSDKFIYEEKSVFDLDFTNTIIYCDPPYVLTAFRARKVWNEEKEDQFWKLLKKWLEPSKNNIVILSNSERTKKVKGLTVKKIYDSDVNYGKWKKSNSLRKEMIFEVCKTKQDSNKKSNSKTMKNKTMKKKTAKNKTVKNKTAKNKTMKNK